MPGLRDTLQALHRCDREAEQLARQREQIPEEIARTEAAVRAAREAVEAERRALETAEHTRREKEAELQDCEARRTKYQGQTAMVKTNEEYTALLAEIDGVTHRISTVEDEILSAMEKIEELTAHLATFERDQKAEEERLEARIGELRERLVEVGREIETRDAMRDEILGGLPSEARLWYDRSRKGRGSGTSMIVGRACGACHRDIPYETINRVLASEVQSCHNCGRLLVMPDEDDQAGA